VPVAHIARGARQEDAREHRDIPAEIVLMQEAILRGELDIADAGLARALIFQRHDGGELQVRGAAIVEIDAARAARAVARLRAGGEGIDLEMAEIRRLRIVAYIRRPGQRRAGREQRNRDYGASHARLASRSAAPSRSTSSASRV